MKNIRSKAAAVTLAGLMALAPLAPVAAFAVDNTPSVGNQTGSGQTELNMILKDVSEHGGTADDLTNPDDDHDGLGDNLAFTVPAAINYVVDADGTLTGPTGIYMENRSNMPIHTSSMQATAENGWTFVADASASTTENSVDIQVGPAADMLQVSEHVAAKKDVNTPSEWNMAATNAGNTDQVAMQTVGDVSHLNQDITSQKKFGTMHWYVTPGVASPAQP